MNNFQMNQWIKNASDVCCGLDYFKNFIDVAKGDGIDLSKAKKMAEPNWNDADTGMINPIFKILRDVDVVNCCLPGGEGLGWNCSGKSKVEFSCFNPKQSNVEWKFSLCEANNSCGNGNMEVSVAGKSIIFNVFNTDNLTLKILRKIGVIIDYYNCCLNSRKAIDFFTENFTGNNVRDVLKNKIAFLNNQRKTYDFICNDGYLNVINLTSDRTTEDLIGHTYNKLPLGNRSKCITKNGGIDENLYNNVYKNFPVLCEIKQCIGNFFAFCDRESSDMDIPTKYNAVVRAFTNAYNYCYIQNNVNNQGRMTVINNLAWVFNVTPNYMAKTFDDIHNLCQQGVQKSGSLVPVADLISNVCIDHFNDNSYNLNSSIQQYHRIQSNKNQKNNMVVNNNNNNNKMVDFSNNLGNCISDVNGINVNNNNNNKNMEMGLL